MVAQRRTRAVSGRCTCSCPGNTRTSRPRLVSSTRCTTPTSTRSPDPCASTSSTRHGARCSVRALLCVRRAAACALDGVGPSFSGASLLRVARTPRSHLPACLLVALPRCASLGLAPDLVNVFSVFLPQLLRYPNPTDPLNGEAAALLLRDPKSYSAKVKGPSTVSCDHREPRRPDLTVAPRACGPMHPPLAHPRAGVACAAATSPPLVHIRFVSRVQST